MSFLTLLIVAGGATFTVVYPIVRYIPLVAHKPKFIWLCQHDGKFLWWPKSIMMPYSPKLFICKLLTPFDVGISIFLVFAGMLGISTMVTGISMMIFNVLTAVGISLGVFIIHKFYRPRWEIQYKKLLAEEKI